MWKGQTVTSKAEAKAAVKFPADRIMALRTDRHMPRKQYNRLIRSMQAVFDQVPNLDLVIHCRPDDEGGRLADTASKYPKHQGRIRATRAHDSWRGIPANELNVLYNAADIYVSNSAEGFGLTIAEAVAAGTPVVGMDYSAVPEVIGPAGVLVPVGHLIDNEYDHYWASVDERAFAKAVVMLANNRTMRETTGKRGPKHVRTMFSWDHAAEQFRDLFDAAIADTETSPVLLPSIEELDSEGVEAVAV